MEVENTTATIATAVPFSSVQLLVKASLRSCPTVCTTGRCKISACCPQTQVRRCSGSSRAWEVSQVQSRQRIGPATNERWDHNLICDGKCSTFQTYLYVTHVRTNYGLHGFVCCSTEVISWILLLKILHDTLHTNNDSTRSDIVSRVKRANFQRRHDDHRTLALIVVFIRIVCIVWAVH